MIKMSIKKLEKNLGFKIKRNVFCLGVDTASTTGLAMVSVDSKYIEVETDIIHLPVLSRKSANDMDKAEKYENAISRLTGLIKGFNYKIRPKMKSIMILEQSYLQRNPETFGYLRCCQGLYYAHLHAHFNEIKIWLPGTVRKMVGFHSNITRQKGLTSKEKTQLRKAKKQEIIDFVNNVLKSKITDDNEADAIMLVFAGLKEV